MKKVSYQIFISLCMLLLFINCNPEEPKILPEEPFIPPDPLTLCYADSVDYYNLPPFFGTGCIGNANCYARVTYEDDVYECFNVGLFKIPDGGYVLDISAYSIRFDTGEKSRRLTFTTGNIPKIQNERYYPDDFGDVGKFDIPLVSNLSANASGHTVNDYYLMDHSYDSSYLEIAVSPDDSTLYRGSFAFRYLHEKPDENDPSVPDTVTFPYVEFATYLTVDSQ